MLLWADSFDHYGTTPNGGRDAMLSGAWAAFGSGNNNQPSISSDQHRTGGNSLYINHNRLATGSGSWARRVFGSPHMAVGHGFGVYFLNLPGSSRQCGVEIRNAANTKIGKITIETDGAILVEALGVDVAISDPKITPNAWHHIEYKWVVDPVVGEIEVRVNGLTVILATDLDTGSVGVSQFLIGTIVGGGTSEAFYIDDMFAWDTTGDINNDFLGAQRAITIFVDGDGPSTDWLVSGTANAYQAIDEVPPDADTTFIYSELSGDVSDFTLPSLPAETAFIAGVYIPTMARLDDAGTGNIKVSMVSGTDVSQGPDTVLTTAYTYWGSSHGLDPATGEPWTKEGVEAALIRVEKTV